MADQFILAHIKNLPIFQKLPAEQLEQVAEVFEAFQVPPNARIFREGQTLPGMYLIVQGRTFLMQTGPTGDEQKIGEVVPYQFIGEAALFKPVVESRSLWVVEMVVLLFLSRERFQQLLAEHPQIKVNLNSKFAPFPEAVKPLFKGQRPEEKVLLIQLRHPWSIIRAGVIPLLLGIIIIVVGMLVFGGTLLALVVAALGVMVPAGWFIYMYAEWRDDAVIITDQRVLKVENVLWRFESNISEVPMSSVHEVNFRYPPGDLVARYLNYGTVEIKTAGTSGNMRLDYIPEPERMQRILLTDKENFQQSVKARNRDAIRSEIDRFLEPEAQTAGSQAAPKAGTMAPPPGWLSTRFENANGEIVYRRHISVWLTHMFLPVLVILGGLALSMFGLLAVPLGALGTVEVILGLFVMLAGGIWAYWMDWDWRNDLLILGSNTLTLIHKRPLFLQNISDKMLLTQIDNVISDKKGVLNTLLDRGNIRISLVGDDKGQGKLFTYVHRPDELQEMISNRRSAVVRGAKDEELQRQRREIAEYIDVYHERLRQQTASQQSAQPNAAPPAPTPVPDRQPPAQRGGARPPRIPRINE